MLIAINSRRPQERSTSTPQNGSFQVLAQSSQLPTANYVAHGRGKLGKIPPTHTEGMARGNCVGLEATFIIGLEAASTVFCCIDNIYLQVGDR